MRSTSACERAMPPVRMTRSIGSPSNAGSSAAAALAIW